MMPFDDSSDEMYNSDLSSSDAERLLRGDIDSPVHADLIAMMSEVRNLSAGTPTPKPGAALSEFVGVGLVTNNNPVGTPEPGIDLRLATTAPAPAMTRRNSVFAQIAAFAGTIGGKVALSGAVAAASISGAHATGVVDVPYLPDTAAEIETVDTELGDESVEVANIPEALTFADDKEPEAEAVLNDGDGDDDAKQEAEADVSSEEKEKVEQVDLTDDLDKKAADEELEAKEAEKRAIEEAEKAELEAKELEAKEAAEEEERAKKEAEEKAELEAKKKAEAEAKEESSGNEAKIAALEEQLNRDKEAVIADAREEIVFYETKRENKEASLENELKEIDEQFSGYVADIDAQIAATDNEEELAELKAYRENKLVWWEEAKEDREAAYAPYLADIDKALEEIETERDAKINALIADFVKAVDELK